MSTLSKGEKSRLLLYRVTKGNPQAILAALDEIKALAGEALNATLESERKAATEKLEQAIIRLEKQFARRLDHIEASIGESIETKIRAIVPTKGEQGDKGDKGDAGYTPSDLRLLALIRPLIPIVRNGVDGKTHTKEEIVALFKPLLADAITALNPTPAQTAETEKALNDKIYGLITKGVGDKLSEIKNFSGGGSGDTVEAGAGVTIETRPSGKKRISVAGLYSIAAPTGSIDDSNLDFVFTEKPTEIVVNGTSYRENHGWTWSSATLTATLAAPVGTGGDVYGRT